MTRVRVVPGGLFVTPGVIALPVSVDMTLARGGTCASVQGVLTYAKSRLAVEALTFAAGWAGAWNPAILGTLRWSAYRAEGVRATGPIFTVTFRVRASYGNTAVRIKELVGGDSLGGALDLSGTSQTVTVIPA